MVTAKTLQLLDANNNNISPAVCVDSLYFEQQSGGTTYRMSLKNRTIVAAENMALNATPGGSNNSLENVTVPYCYVEAVTGLSGEGMVYSLNTGTYNIGQQIKNVLNLENNYYSKTDVDNNFMPRFPDPSAYIGSVTDTSLCVFSNSYTKLSGIIMGEGNGTEVGYIICDRNPANASLGIYNPGMLNIGTKSGVMNVSVGNTINVLSSDSINIESRDIEVSTNNMMTLNSSTIVLDAVGEVRLTTTTGNYVAISKNSIGINSSAIYLYYSDSSFPLPNNTTEKNKHLVLQKKSKKMIWEDLGTLSVTSSDNSSTGNIVFDGSENKVLFTKYLDFIGKGGGTINNDIKQGLLGNSPIYIRGLKCQDVYQTLFFDNTATDGYNNDPVIRLKTIGGQNLFTTQSDDTANIDVVPATDTTYHSKTSLKVIKISDSNRYYLLGCTESEISKINTSDTTVDSNGEFNVQDNIYYTNGRIYAVEYYASSDERLKDDIQELSNDETKNFPSVKQFDWKSNGEHSYGFIAQEVEDAGFDNLVYTDENGYKKVNYNAALSVAVAKLENENKELRDEIKSLKETVNQLINLVKNN